tara:strand:- start:267 stop:569 length:303 start_codon:yes stop_codon:yes gene_type:complete
MPIEISVGRKTYESTKSKHSEEVMFDSGKYDGDSFTAEMNGWPCTGERYHNCHELFIKKSAGRVITVVVEADHGGYAANHDKNFSDIGTITYAKGVVTYS